MCRNTTPTSGDRFDAYEWREEGHHYSWCLYGGNLRLSHGEVASSDVVVATTIEFIVLRRFEESRSIIIG